MAAPAGFVEVPVERLQELRAAESVLRKLVKGGYTDLQRRDAGCMVLIDTSWVHVTEEELAQLERLVGGQGED